MVETGPVEIRQTAMFAEWLDTLKDKTAAARIAKRLARIRAGLLGDVKSVGGGVSEIRVDYGPGYRVYFARRGLFMIILLCGGDKTTQPYDIKIAKAIAAELEI